MVGGMLAGTSNALMLEMKAAIEYSEAWPHPHSPKTSKVCPTSLTIKVILRMYCVI